MKLRVAVLGLAVSMGASQSAVANDAVGVWLTDEGKAKVRLSECGQRLCSEIIWLREPTDERGRPLRDIYNPDPRLRNRPIIGMEILQDLRPVGPNQWSGQIYNPENGKMYTAHLTVGGDAMRLRGCVSWGWPCGEQTWTRISETVAEPPKARRAPAELRQARAPNVPAPPPADTRRAAPDAAAVSGVVVGTAVAAPRPPVAPPRAQPARNTADDYLVQIASRQSERDALTAFAELQQRYPDLLGSFRPRIKMADLGAKGIWYRVHVGPMDDKSLASNFCERLKAAGADCLLRRIDE